MPLAQAITGVPLARCGASAVTAARRYCAGVAISMMSARAAAAISAVTSMPVVETHAGQPRIFTRRGDLRGDRGVARAEHDIAAGPRGDGGQRRSPCAGADHAYGFEGRHRVNSPAKIPRGFWRIRPAPWRWRRAASGRGGRRPWCRPAQAPAAPRRPRRSSRHCRCTAPAAE